MYKAEFRFRTIILVNMINFYYKGDRQGRRKKFCEHIHIYTRVYIDISILL